MSYTLTSSLAILYKAGLNVNANAAASNTLIAKFSDMAEAIIVAKSRYDWVANFASVRTNFKPILDDAASSYAAELLINYDPSGYTNENEALTMINVNRDNFERSLGILKEKEVQDFALSV